MCGGAVRLRKYPSNLIRVIPAQGAASEDFVGFLFINGPCLRKGVGPYLFEDRSWA